MSELQKANCDYCSGTGEIFIYDENGPKDMCPECNGTGEHPQEKITVAQAVTDEPAQSAEPTPREATCLDCNKPYSQFKLDVVLPKDEWLQIHPDENGLLCAQCIVNRAEKIPNVICIKASLERKSYGLSPREAEAVEEASRNFGKLVSINPDYQKIASDGFEEGAEWERQHSDQRIKELVEENVLLLKITNKLAANLKMYGNDKNGKQWFDHAFKEEIAVLSKFNK